MKKLAILCVLLCATTSAQEKNHTPKAIKVYEQHWDGDTSVHWECPKGFHVYWWEVNVLPSGPFEYVPECRENDNNWPWNKKP
jgi:hypothetical protein